jgi:type I restriction enzyme M protein
MKGDDGSRIKQGNTLSDDKLIGLQFNFMMVNPEFGTDWKKIEDTIRKEADRGFDGRFGAGLPDVGDASFLFLQHMISKMTPLDKGGSVIGIVFNGSPLFNGDAGSGWSDIRKWIIQNDWLDAIVALPEDMFYNTNIATYLWIVRNNKPAHRRGTITLVNGNQDHFRTLMRRNLGKKRVELTPDTIAKLVSVYREGKPVPKFAQVFDLEDFGYTRVVVERPLRLRFEITDERLAEFQKSGFYTGLVVTKKVGDKAKADIARGQEKQRVIVATLEKAKALCPCRNDRAFQQFVNDELPFKATGQLITALRSAFGENDEMAEKVLLKPLEPDLDLSTAEADPGNWYQTDGSLRDEERIPLKTNINDYFAKEVLPYAPDAWMDRSKDKVGYEINFAKYFYEYRPPRALKAILSDLEALDTEADKLQAELRA